MRFYGRSDQSNGEFCGLLPLQAACSCCVVVKVPNNCKDDPVLRAHACKILFAHAKPFALLRFDEHLAKVQGFVGAAKIFWFEWQELDAYGRPLEVEFIEDGVSIWVLAHCSSLKKNSPTDSNAIIGRSGVML
jgi:hypothetical protein